MHRGVSVINKHVAKRAGRSGTGRFGGNKVILVTILILFNTVRT